MRLTAALGLWLVFGPGWARAQDESAPEIDTYDPAQARFAAPPPAPVPLRRGASHA